MLSHEARTAVIIAHRLSTVEIADRVVVVAPADLLGRDGRYRELHRAWTESLA